MFLIISGPAAGCCITELFRLFQIITNLGSLTEVVWIVKQLAVELLKDEAGILLPININSGRLTYDNFPPSVVCNGTFYYQALLVFFTVSNDVAQLRHR